MKSYKLNFKIINLFKWFELIIGIVLMKYFVQMKETIYTQFQYSNGFYLDII